MYGKIRSYERAVETMSEIRDYIAHQKNKSRSDESLNRDLRDTALFIANYFGERGYKDQMRRAEHLASMVSSEISLSEAGMIVSGLVDSFSLPLRGSIPLTRFVEPKLERRIEELESELAYLRSNPKLEKKVAKLEREVRKLRVPAIPERVERKQEDMLKKFKSAEKKIFVIMPFAPIFDDVWKGGIERACNTEDLGYLRVDKISLSSWITEDIKEYLKMSDFVVADVTGNNPNVMFELGWALALGKKPIVVRQKDDPNTVPFDVKDIRYIPYVNSWSGIERLYANICKFIKSTSETLNEKPTEKKNRRKKTSKK